MFSCFLFLLASFSHVCVCLNSHVMRVIISQDERFTAIFICFLSKDTKLEFLLAVLALRKGSSYVCAFDIA